MADDWLDWMKSIGYADGTIGRIVKFAKEYFRYAERKELILANPFADLKGPPQTTRLAR
jgi:site-specific recombinase XerD